MSRSGRLIEYCAAGDLRQTAEIVSALRREFPEVEMREQRCLNHCHRCGRAPFLLLDGRTLLERAEPAELLAEARRRLREANPRA